MRVEVVMEASWNRLGNSKIWQIGDRLLGPVDTYVCIVMSPGRYWYHSPRTDLSADEIRITCQITVTRLWNSKYVLT